MDFFNRKRVLVTGGAGFLGSHLCERLLNDGCDVICLDNFYSSSKYNVMHLRDNPHFELIRHDITMPIRLEVDVKYIIWRVRHLPCITRADVQTIKTNVHGAINMLELAKITQAKIFQASTSEVYGDPQIHPQNEHYWGNVIL